MDRWVSRCKLAAQLRHTSRSLMAAAELCDELDLAKLSFKLIDLALETIDPVADLLEASYRPPVAHQRSDCPQETLPF